MDLSGIVAPVTSISKLMSGNLIGGSYLKDIDDYFNEKLDEASGTWDSISTALGWRPAPIRAGIDKLSEIPVVGRPLAFGAQAVTDPANVIPAAGLAKFGPKISTVLRGANEVPILDLIRNKQLGSAAVQAGRRTAANIVEPIGSTPGEAFRNELLLGAAGQAAYNEAEARGADMPVAFGSSVAAGGLAIISANLIRNSIREGIKNGAWNTFTRPGGIKMGTFEAYSHGEGYEIWGPDGTPASLEVGTIVTAREAIAETDQALLDGFVDFVNTHLYQGTDYTYYQRYNAVDVNGFPDHEISDAIHAWSGMNAYPIRDAIEKGNRFGQKLYQHGDLLRQYLKSISPDGKTITLYRGEKHLIELKAQQANEYVRRAYKRALQKNPNATLSERKRILADLKSIVTDPYHRENLTQSKFFKPQVIQSYSLSPKVAADFGSTTVPEHIRFGAGIDVDYDLTRIARRQVAIEDVVTGLPDFNHKEYELLVLSRPQLEPKVLQALTSPESMPIPQSYAELSWEQLGLNPDDISFLAKFADDKGYDYQELWQKASTYIGGGNLSDSELQGLLQLGRDYFDFMEWLRAAEQKAFQSGIQQKLKNTYGFESYLGNVAALNSKESQAFQSGVQDKLSVSNLATALMQALKEAEGGSKLGVVEGEAGLPNISGAQTRQNIQSEDRRNSILTRLRALPDNEVVREALSYGLELVDNMDELRTLVATYIDQDLSSPPNPINILREYEGAFMELSRSALEAAAEKRGLPTQGSQKELVSRIIDSFIDEAGLVPAEVKLNTPPRANFTHPTLSKPSTELVHDRELIAQEIDAVQLPPSFQTILDDLQRAYPYTDELFGPEAGYRQPDGKGGYVTSATQLGEAPPRVPTAEDILANERVYAEGITPTGSAMANPPRNPLNFEPENTALYPPQSAPVRFGETPPSIPTSQDLLRREVEYAEGVTKPGTAMNIPTPGGPTKFPEEKFPYAPDMFGAEGSGGSGVPPHWTDTGATQPGMDGVPQPPKKLYNGKDALTAFNQLIKSMWATADASGFGIQALMPMARLALSGNTDAIKTIFKDSYLHMLDEKHMTAFLSRHNQVWGQIDPRLNIEWLSKNGLQVSSTTLDSDISITGQLATKPIIAQSQRLFHATGDLARIGIILNEFNLRGGTRLTDDQLKQIIHSANRISGHSDTQILGPNSGLFLFAPRFFTSQIETVVKAFEIGTIEGDIARKSIVSLLGIAAALTFGANIATGEYSHEMWDPRSSNFMRIKNIGGQDISLLATWDSLIRGVARMAQDPQEGTAFFLRSKSSPIVSITWDLLTGKDFMGDEVTAANFIPNLITPFSYKDLGSQPMWTVPLNVLGVKSSPQTPGEVLEARMEAQGLDPNDPLDRRNYLASHPEDYPKGTREDTIYRDSVRGDIKLRTAMNDQRALTNQITLDEWRETRKTLLREQRIRLDTIFRSREPRAPKNQQESWINSYFQLFESNSDPVTGDIVSDSFDKALVEWISVNGESAYNYVQDYMLVGRSPLETAYLNNLNQLKKLNYFNMPKLRGMVSGVDESVITDLRRRVSAERSLNPVLAKMSFQQAAFQVLRGYPASVRMDVGNAGLAQFRNPKVAQMEALYPHLFTWFNPNMYYQHYAQITGSPVDPSTMLSMEQNQLLGAS